MLEYSITAATTGPARATAQCKDAQIELDTDLAGRADAFNPAELLLTAVAACMLKGIERVGPMLGLQWRGAHVRVHGVRQDAPPRMLRIDYELVVDSEESDARLELLHRNVRKFGTISNTVAAAVELTGTVRRAATSTGSP
jgi:uncharacterized OsmC-like protein